MKKRHLIKYNALIWLLSALAGIPVASWGATLVNRYSFDETSGITATDSVSGANATLNGGADGTASFNGAGQAVLSQNIAEEPSTDAAGGYISLPPTILSNYTAVTIEAWATPTLDSTGNPYARVWDFGNSSGTAGTVGGNWARFGDTVDGVELDAWTAVTGDNYLYSTTIMNDQTENHVVWTGDASTHIEKLYLNGVVISTSYTFTNSPAVVGTTTNDWLGRSQWPDPLANASYDEFRIYNGAISALQVAADDQNSPETLATVGAISSVALQFISTNIPQGSSQTPELLATAGGVSSPVDIHDDPGTTWTSSNTNVASVDVHGVVTGLGAGTATIVGTYESVSATQLVTVFSLPVTMLDRYSFNETSGTTAHDSIAGMDATLNGDAAFDGNGQVDLDGTSGTWVDLPAHLLDASRVTANAVTIEVWATPYPVNGAWTRLFDFGNISGNNGANYLYCAPDTAANGGSSRVAVSDSSPGYSSEDGFDLGNMLGETNLHVVVVFNPNPSRKFLGLYTNGIIAGSITTTKSYSAIVNDYSFVGRSTYSGDSWFNGSFNEVRIYNGELNKFQIAASDQAGPDKTNFNVGTFTSFNLNAGALPIAAGVQRQIQAIMNFSLVTNVVVNGDSTLSFSSSDSTIATVNNAGLITTLKTGTATITGIYGFVSGGTTTYYTNSVPVSTFLDYPATLTHRYSFTNDTSDSVGGPAWSGTLMGSATVSGGQLILPNATSVGPALDYLQLPAGIITNSVDPIGTNNTDPAVTVEAWATVAPGQYTWANLFDFGNQDSGGLAEYDIHVAVQANPSDALIGISDSDNANVDYQFFDAGTGTGFDGQTNLYIAAVFDPSAGYVALYTNGVMMGENSSVTISLAGVMGIINKIGADNWPDPGMQGSVDEFRIYNGVLHPAEIAADYLLGPNQLPSAAPAAPLLHVALSGTNLVVTWTASGTSGYTLQSTLALIPGAVWSGVSGTPTLAGGNYQLTVPITKSAQFFELKQ
jgi:hypothetical protein